jgi:hypothetical protein
MNVNELIDALDEIKRITKGVPAHDWTPELREIVNIAHRTLRDHGTRRSVSMHTLRRNRNRRDSRHLQYLRREAQLRKLTRIRSG